MISEQAALNMNLGVVLFQPSLTRSLIHLIMTFRYGASSFLRNSAHHLSSSVSLPSPNLSGFISLRIARITASCPKRYASTSLPPKPTLVETSILPGLPSMQSSIVLLPILTLLNFMLISLRRSCTVRAPLLAAINAPM